MTLIKSQLFTAPSSSPPPHAMDCPIPSIDDNGLCQGWLFLGVLKIHLSQRILFCIRADFQPLRDPKLWKSHRRNIASWLLLKILAVVSCYVFVSLSKKFDSLESPPTCHYRRIPARNSHSADIKPKANYMIIPERVLQGGQRDAVVSDHIHFIMRYCTTSAFIPLNISSAVKNVHLLYVPYPLPQPLFKTYLGVPA